MHTVSHWRMEWLALLLAAAGCLFAARPASSASLELDVATTQTTNTTVTLPLSLGLGPGEAVSAFQCDVVITGAPLSFVSATALPPIAAAGKTLSVNPISAVRWRLLVSGFNQNAIAPGELIALEVGLASEAGPGLYAVTLENAVLSSPSGGSVATTTTNGGVEFAIPTFHSGDVDRDHRFSLSELLRIIQLYNAREHHCEENSEDGYALGPGPTGCGPHSSDYQGGPDWSIELGELLRAIQFYSVGGYEESPDTEDGFAPVALRASDAL